MALAAGALLAKQALEAQILLLLLTPIDPTLTGLGWQVGSSPSEGTEKDNPAVAPTVAQKVMASAIANAVVDQMLVWFTLYGEVVGGDTDDGATNPGSPAGGPFTTPVIS